MVLSLRGGIVGDATLATAKDDGMGVLHMSSGMATKDVSRRTKITVCFRAKISLRLLIIAARSWEQAWRVGTRDQKGRDARRQCDYVVVEHKLLYSKMLLLQRVL